MISHISKKLKEAGNSMNMNKKSREVWRGTTVMLVRRKGKAVIAGDGQVTLGDTVMKRGAKKVRKMYHDEVIAGFAGATADAFTLFERFEEKLEKFQGNLIKAAVELAKDWRMDKMLRRLEALLLVANKERIFIISGTGDVIEPDEEVAAIGSGGPYAYASAQALLKHTKLDAKTIAEESMQIAAGICVYTNNQISIEELK